MTDEIETKASAYFHIGNGGVTFSVRREPEGSYGNGPHLCVSGSSHGTKMLGVDIQTTPSSLRALGLELLEAATEDYPRPGPSALTTRGSVPQYHPWRWAEFRPYQGDPKGKVAKMRRGEPVQEVERARSEEEKNYYEKAKRLQKRVAVLRAEAERLEEELAEHQLHTPKMWKRRQGDAWVDHEQPDLVEIMLARAKLHLLSPEDLENVQRAVEGLTTLFRLVRCDEPWKMEIVVVHVGGWPPEKWGEFEGAVRQRADERGWDVETTKVPSGRMRVPEIKHRLEVSRGGGVIVLAQHV
jgi:hypothetical protein